MAACAYDEDSTGQKASVDFRDAPHHWYTTNHRKQATLWLLREDPTQRDSQATQPATELVASSEAISAPVLGDSALSPTNDDDLHDKKELKEERAHNQMTNYEEQEAFKSTRKFSEVEVILPKAVVGDCGIGTNDESDSDVSDDMLEQAGSIGELPSFAASLQKRDLAQRGTKMVCKLSTPLRVSPAISCIDDFGSSGGETEIESEPKEESPVKIQTHMAEKKTLSKGKMPAQLTKGVRFPKMASNFFLPTLERKGMGQLLSTLEKTHNSTSRSCSNSCEQHETLYGSQLGRKRSRRDEDDMPLHSSDRASSLTNRKGRKCSDEDFQREDSKAPRDSFVVVNDNTKEVFYDKSRIVELGKLSPHLASRSPCETSTSSHGRKHGLGGQLEGRSIRIILTGIEPTALIRKKIKSIVGAVYENDVEKATHLIAPQNQLKRTVKVLCGISCCTHFLGEQWLHLSAQAGVAVDEHANCLRDVEAENKWHFNMRTTMYGVATEQRRCLFASYSVYITNHKSLLPPVADLVKIIKCAGGKATSKGKPGSSDIVISSEAALATATVRKQLVNFNPERIYSSELILRSILQQRVELENHRL